MRSQTIFIVPRGTQSLLTDDGWIFTSSALLRDSVMEKILQEFNVSLVEEFHGIRKFQNDQTQVNIVFSDEGRIAEIALRTATAGLADRLRALLSGEEVDILIPEIASPTA
jgi:hypothetical protein